MRDVALVASAAMLGVAAVPHCLAMCGAAGGAVLRGCGREKPWRAAIGFHAGRVAGYAAGGALASTGVSALRLVGEAAPVLRPVWSMLHVAALALGLWLLWRGRQPGWMGAWGRPKLASPDAGGWQRVAGPTRATGAGAAWVAWPCGVLQSAVIVASLAHSAAGGAAAMAVFALASSPGLWAWQVPWPTRGRAPWVSGSLAVRGGGLALAAGSAWALGHGLWMRVAAYCFS